jgi:hypothetical protein
MHEMPNNLPTTKITSVSPTVITNSKKPKNSKMFTKTWISFNLNKEGVNSSYFQGKNCIKIHFDFTNCFVRKKILPDSRIFLLTK